MIRSAALALMLAALPTVSPPADDLGPDRILVAIYSAYGPDSAPEDVPERFFSPDLLALYDAVEAGVPRGEMGIDFDIFIDAQDIEAVKDLSLYVWDLGPRARDVDARFTVFGEPRAIRYSFVATPQGWKIDNIIWRGESENLRSHLRGLKARQGAP
jgi:hypothetical protein